MAKKPPPMEEEFGEPEDVVGDDSKSNKRPRPANRNVTNPMEAEEFFGIQYDKTADLPDPTGSLQAVATGVVEVIAGTRPINQLARLLSEEVYDRLSLRAKIAREDRESKGIKARYQMFRIQKIAQESPRDGVIESVVLVNTAHRTRAVTIRLEGINHRWRATSVSVL